MTLFVTSKEKEVEDINQCEPISKIKNPTPSSNGMIVNPGIKVFLPPHNGVQTAMVGVYVGGAGATGNPKSSDILHFQSPLDKPRIMQQFTL